MTLDLARAAQVLSDATDVSLACHVNPDADARLDAWALGVPSVTRGAHRARIPTSRSSLPAGPGCPGAEDLVPAKKVPKEPAVMVTCDCAAFDRLAQLGHVADRAGELIWIDHHRSNDGLGTIPLIDPRRPRPARSCSG